MKLILVGVARLIMRELNIYGERAQREMFQVPGGVPERQELPLERDASALLQKMSDSSNGVFRKALGYAETNQLAEPTTRLA